MATNIDTSRLAGFFKDRFGDNASALPSEGYDVLQSRIKFSEPKLGEKLTQPVRMAHSTGWTFAGGSTTGTMFALNDANSPQTVEASWTSQEFVLRERTSWKALRAAQTNAQAFANAYDDMIRDMKNSADFALEFSMLYGQTALGQIESGTGSTTNRVYTLSKASSTAGLWYKMQGALFDVYDASSGGSKLNSNADVVVVSADLDDSTGKVEVTVTGNASDLSAIDSDISTGAYLIPKGADGNMMPGIDKVASNTGTYAGISASTYPLWRSTSLNANSAGVSFSKFLHALKKNRLKSGPGRRTALVSEATIADIIDNLSALQRMVNKGKGSFELGGDGVTYSMPGGSIEFLPHVLVKEGEAFLLDLSQFKRIGSVDFTFDPTGKGEYFEHVSGYAGLELMGYWDQTLICKKPSSITKITGIVNTF